MKAYLVGGAVRDRLLGLKIKDWDYAVEAPSFEAMVTWVKTNGTVYLESPEYWTVRGHVGRSDADFVLCRKDGSYSDGRRPDSVEMGTILDDLARRDFTVNAIAWDEDNKFHIDPFDGQKDLADMKLRCVGNAYDRLFEDSLRMLRAIRFCITKDFTLDDELFRLLGNTELCERLKKNVSLDRKREELKRCFQHDTMRTICFLRTFEGIMDACFADGKLKLEPTSRKF